MKLIKLLRGPIIMLFLNVATLSLLLILWAMCQYTKYVPGCPDEAKLCCTTSMERVWVMGELLENKNLLQTRTYSLRTRLILIV